MDIFHHSISDKGKRATNQDALLSLHLGPGTFYFAVADGMGGAKGGDIASNLVLQSVEKYLNDYFSNNYVNADSLKTILNETYIRAHDAISDYIISNPDHEGMGTTLTSLLIMGKHCVWGNLGDSRIYQINNNHVRRITKDHNYLEDNASVDIQNMAVIPPQLANVLTKVLDGSYSQADIYPWDAAYQTINDNTMWLICSDGLITNKQENHEDYLGKMIKRYPRLNILAENLTKQALEAGSTDNISIILIQAKDTRESSGSTTRKIKPARSPKKKYQYLIIGILLILTIAFIVLLFVNDLLEIPDWLKNVMACLHNENAHGFA